MPLDLGALPGGAHPLLPPHSIADQCGKHALCGLWEMLDDDKSNVYIAHVCPSSLCQRTFQVQWILLANGSNALLTSLETNKMRMCLGVVSETKGLLHLLFPQAGGL